MYSFRLDQVGTKDVNLIFCVSPMRRGDWDEDRSDRYYTPASMMTLVRPGKDIIILPGNMLHIRDFAQFCATMLGWQTWQFLFTSGDNYSLETNARLELASTIKRIIRRRGGSWLLVPYTRTPESEMLAQSIGLTLPPFGQSSEWIAEYGCKAALHPHIGSSVDCQANTLGDIPGIRIVDGWYAETTAELVDAKEKLRACGYPNAVLKPNMGDGGQGIEFIGPRTSVDRYGFDMGPVVIERRLPLKRDAHGVVALSRHCIGGNIGPLTRQVFLNRNTVYGGTDILTNPDPGLERQTLEMMKGYVKLSQPEGMLGVDFLVTEENGRDVAWFSDPNPRPTEAVPLIWFRSLYTGEYGFATAASSRKFVPSIPIDEYWDEIKRLGLALILGETKTGAFPLCYLPGDTGVLGVFASTDEEVQEILKRLEHLL